MVLRCKEGKAPRSSSPATDIAASSRTSERSATHEDHKSPQAPLVDVNVPKSTKCKNATPEPSELGGLFGLFDGAADFGLDGASDSNSTVSDKMRSITGKLQQHSDDFTGCGSVHAHFHFHGRQNAPTGSAIAAAVDMLESRRRKMCSDPSTSAREKRPSDSSDDFAASEKWYTAGNAHSMETLNINDSTLSSHSKTQNMSPGKPTTWEHHQSAVRTLNINDGHDEVRNDVGRCAFEENDLATDHHLSANQSLQGDSIWTDGGNDGWSNKNSSSGQDKKKKQWENLDDWGDQRTKSSTKGNNAIDTWGGQAKESSKKHHERDTRSNQWEDKSARKGDAWIQNWDAKDKESVTKMEKDQNKYRGRPNKVKTPSTTGEINYQTWKKDQGDQAQEWNNKAPVKASKQYDKQHKSSRPSSEKLDGAFAANTVANPVKQYWGQWNAASHGYNVPHHPASVSSVPSKILRDPYVAPAYNLPRICADFAAAWGIEAQVRTGRGANYYHKVGHPIYIDSMECPYAVFTFKYRTRAVIEKKLGTSIDQDEENARAKIKKMSRDELEAQLLTYQV